MHVGTAEFEIGMVMGKYIGEVVDQKAHGEGVFTNKTGKFQGLFRNNMADGLCKCLIPTKSLVGQVTLKDGSIWIGEVSEN